MENVLCVVYRGFKKCQCVLDFVQLQKSGQLLPPAKLMTRFSKFILDELFLEDRLCLVLVLGITFQQGKRNTNL